jgi:hypothetical protein
VADAKAYIASTLFFTVGSAKLAPPWKVIPVDGNTLAPLTPDSQEIHLLCEYQGNLPDVPGGFQVNVGTRCAVGVVLLNRMEGDPEPGLQALFPGEPSRRFPLPEPGKRPAAAVSKTSGVSRETAKPALGWFAWSAGQISRLDCGVMLIFATVLLRGRFLAALGLLLAFHLGESVFALALQNGGLAAVQRWAGSLGWLFLVLAAVAAVISVVSSRKRWLLPLAAIFLGGTGACWEIPPESMAWLLWRHAAVLVWQTAFLAVLFLGCKVLQKARETPSLGPQGTLLNTSSLPSSLADDESRRDERE